MIEWKRHKTGEYQSKDGRFLALKHLTNLYNEWYLYDYHKVRSYRKPTYTDCKLTAEKILKKENEIESMNELQIQGWLYFKTRKANIKDTMDEVYAALKDAGFDLGECPHLVLRDDGDEVIDER